MPRQLRMQYMLECLKWLKLHLKVSLSSKQGKNIPKYAQLDHFHLKSFLERTFLLPMSIPVIEPYHKIGPKVSGSYTKKEHIISIVIFSVVFELCACMPSHCHIWLWLHGLWPSRILCSWNFLGKSTGVGFHFLLHGIFQTQGLNPCLLHLLHWLVDSLITVPPGKPQC